MFEADGDGVGEGAAVLAATVVEGLVGGAEGEDLVEDLIVHDGLELVDGFAGGVEGADHAAHAGSGDHVDGDVVLLEPLEDADLGHGEGSAAAEGKADARAIGRPWRRDGRGHGAEVGGALRGGIGGCGRGAGPVGGRRHGGTLRRTGLGGKRLGAKGVEQDGDEEERRTERQAERGRGDPGGTHRSRLQHGRGSDEADQGSIRAHGGELSVERNLPLEGR
jgi:hypothetical protein